MSIWRWWTVVGEDAPVNDHIATPSPTAAATSAPALRPVRGAARIAIATLGLAGAAWAARAVWEIRLAVAGEPASGPPDQGGGVHRPLTSLEDSYHLVSAAGGFVGVACVFAFLVWLDRVRDNARELSGSMPHYSGLWLYLAWVLPVANLWIPRSIVAQVHQDSAPGERLPRSVNIWWALWLIGLLGGVGYWSSGDTDQVIDLAYNDVWIPVVSDAAVVGAAVAGIFVVRAITAVQLRRTEPRLT
ncbi:DUF4328 domain-containing protein [Streptomyces sp. NPDC001617]